MGACSSGLANEEEGKEYATSGITKANVSAGASGVTTAASGGGARGSMMYSSTWAGPTSYSIDEGESVYGLFPPTGHRRTRSGYSRQLAYDPVHERKMNKLKEIRQSQSMAEMLKERQGEEESCGSLTPPPLGGGISPVAPTSLRSKKTRPIRLKENRRITSGHEVLAPRRSRLKSKFHKQMEAQKERMAREMEDEAVKVAVEEEDGGEKQQGDVTPLAANINQRRDTRRRFSPPKPLDTSPAATPRTSHHSAQSPKGALKSPSRERVVSPFTEDLSLDIQRASVVQHSPKSGATSPKGANKSPSVAKLRSPNGEKGFFPDIERTSLSVATSGSQVDSVLHSPLSGAMSPKGKRKTPTGLGASFVAASKTDENDAGTGNRLQGEGTPERVLLQSPTLRDLALSPRGRRGKREKDGVMEWHCTPKQSVKKNQRSLREGGGGHLHPSARKGKK